MKSNILTLAFILLSVLATAQNNTRPNVFLPAVTGMQVNSYSGSLYLERQDLFVPGRGLDIDFTFSYNSSLDTSDWGYGFGWTHTYNMNYSLQADTFRLVKSDGRRDIYIKNGNAFQPMAGIFDVLTEYQTGKFLLRTKSGMKYFFDDATHRKLTKMEDRNGNALTMSYTGGKLSAVTDASGRQITLSFQNNHLASITDALETPTRTWSYTYDQGYLYTVTNPLGGQWLYAYDEQHNLIRTTNENSQETTVEYFSNGTVKAVATCLSRHSFTYNLDQGKSIVTEIVGDGTQTTTYEFDAQGRNTARKGNCCGFETTFQYDNSNNITQSTDANGNTSNYAFDDSGNATQINDPTGCNIQMQYEPNFNQSTSFKDKNGNTTSFTYDPNGNLTAVARPLGVSESYAYDAFGNQTSHTDGRGNTTTYVYNASGYLTQINHPVGSLTTQFSYDNRGNKLTQTDANGHITKFKYDALNRLTETEDPLGNKTLYLYDARGNKTKETNALGNATEYQYDPLDRLIEAKAPLNVVTKYAYDSRGNLLQETDPRGSVTTYTYDARNFLVSQKDPLGNETTYAYDGIGNQTSVTDPNGNTTQYTYDNLNRLTKTKDALGFETNYAYDCNGNPLSVTDANGNTTAYAYDALNRQTAMTDALGFTTNFEFDKNNNLTKITDAKGNPTSYEYDALNRKTKETFADNTTKVFTYDGAGNVSSRKDNAGNLTFYTYDPANRLTLRDYPDANDDHFSYDALGRMTEATNQNAVVTYAYDALNRTLGETLNGKTTGYAYNTATGKRTLIYPSGRVIEEYYDTRNQLANIKESNESLAAFAYDPAGRMTTRSYGNGTVTTYSYDDNNRVTRILANPGAFIDLHYAYDNVGNKLYEEKKHHPTHSEQYGYDAKYQLTSYKVGTLAGGAVTAPMAQTAYNYDALGNRVTVVKDGAVTSYEVNEMNEYTDIMSLQPIVINYNENGSVTKIGDVETFFDFENKVNKTIRNNYISVLMFDALGRKVQENRNSELISYYYDGHRIIEIANDINTFISSFVYGEKIDEVLQFAQGIDKFYYQINDKSTVLSLSNSNGNVVERIEYDAFGMPTVWDSGFINNLSITANEKFYTGRDYSLQTGLFDYRKRSYSPTVGIFLSVDPLGYFDELNLHSYTRNNPINFTDPFGLCIDCGEQYADCVNFADQILQSALNFIEWWVQQQTKIVEGAYNYNMKNCNNYSDPYPRNTCKATFSASRLVALGIIGTWQYSSTTAANGVFYGGMAGCLAQQKSCEEDNEKKCCSNFSSNPKNKPQLPPWTPPSDFPDLSDLFK